MIEQTPEIGELVKALAVAQGKITGALKDSANPFFKSKYADLASVWDACRGPLSENGIAIIQQTTADDSGVFVITTLAHASGQWMRSTLRLHPKDDTPQGIGSAITYGRRYALAAAVGVAQVDDDGNAASGRSNYADPRGDLGKDADPKKVDAYVKRFREAFDADKEEEDVCAMVYEIHSEVSADHDLYIAIGKALGSADSKKLKDCIAFHKKQRKAA